MSDLSSKTLAKWPERIYLQRDYECAEEGCGPHSGDDGETTWCKDKIHDTDVEYVRADLARVSDEPSAGVKCTHCNGKGYNEPIYDEQDGWTDETPCETCNGSGRITTVEQYLKTLPANWHEDSSLETWFPITAEELKRLKDERASQPPSARLIRNGTYIEAIIDGTRYLARVKESLYLRAAVTKSEEPEPEHVCDGGWACHFHDVKKAADETASCIFQSETGGHADEYVSFLCDLASACMELKALRAAHGPATTESPRGLVMDHLRGLVADHDNRVASGVMPEWGSPIRAHKTVIEAIRAFLRAADEPKPQASNEVARKARDAAGRTNPPMSKDTLLLACADEIERLQRENTRLHNDNIDLLEHVPRAVLDEFREDYTERRPAVETSAAAELRASPPPTDALTLEQLTAAIAYMGCDTDREYTPEAFARDLFAAARQSSTKSEIPAAAQSAANSGQCESRKAAQSGTAAGASVETSEGQS